MHSEAFFTAFVQGYRVALSQPKSVTFTIGTVCRATNYKLKATCAIHVLYPSALIKVAAVVKSPRERSAVCVVMRHLEDDCALVGENPRYGAS